MTDTKVKVFYCSLMLQIKIKYPLIVQLEKYDPLSSNFGLDINVDIHLNFDLFFRTSLNIIYLGSHLYYCSHVSNSISVNPAVLMWKDP